MSIQHEYGIWGGEDGEHVLDFVRALRVPSVVTLHTVLREPTPHQRSVLRELVATAETSVVMSRSAADLLIRGYDVDARRLQVIPHGVPNVPLVDSATVKPALGVAGRDVILSFGLLGPGKGYEHAIEALPAVAAANPDVLYVIVGATHPDLISNEGEAYRQSLTDRIARLGMERHVRFVDRFVGRAELDAVAAGGGCLRDALSEPRPDRVRDAVVRDGRRPGRRLDAVHLREGAPGRWPRRPRRARLCNGARRRPAIGARRPGTARRDRPACPRLQPANGLARRRRGIRRAVREPRPGHPGAWPSSQRGQPIHA